MAFRILPRQRKLAPALCNAARHEGGIAATEFALVLPFLLLVLMGVIELSNALLAKRKLLNAVQSASDLIGQQADVTAQDLSTVYKAAHLTMNPLNTTGMKLGVASVRFDDLSGSPLLDWTHNSNGGVVEQPLSKAVGRGEAGASIVIVSGTYTYKPLIRLILPVDIDMHETAYVRPRKVSYIIKH